MKRKLAILREQISALKRWLEDRKADVFFTIWLIFFSTFALLVSGNPAEGNYRLVNTIFSFATFECRGREKWVAFYYYLYNNIRTKFTIDLIICLNQDGQILFVNEVDERGQWQKRDSLPPDFPPDRLFKELPEEVPQPPEEKKTLPSTHQIAGLPNQGAFFLSKQGQSLTMF